MDLERSMTVSAPPDVLFSFVDELDDYPAWMGLVHAAQREPTGNASDGSDGGATPAWSVELRASIGPFARSKRLRMIRTVLDAPHRACFERAELDGKEHAAWRLEATVRPADTDSGAGESELTMRLHYGGRLWTGGVLERALEDQIAGGREQLRDLVEGVER